MNFNNPVKRSKLALQAFWLICSFLLVFNFQPTHAQNLAGQTLNTKEAKRDREMGLAMLKEMKKILEEHYYDPKYRGIDLKPRFKAAENRIRTLNYNWQVYRVLAQLLLDFNDSHTALILPRRTDHFEYGFTTQMIGDECVVVSIKKGSDAEKKGLRVGDEVLRIGQFAPTRESLWKIMYLIYKLDPAKTVDLKIKNLAGVEAQMTVAAKTIPKRNLRRDRKSERMMRKRSHSNARRSALK